MRQTDAVRWNFEAWRGVALLLVCFAVLVVVIAPLREFPIEDDWDYSKTVLNLLQTGSFHRLEVTQATVFFPAVWGALFATIFGYSFATLRLATLVLALGALLFFYALLGELEFDWTRCVLATLALMLTPAFLYLAFSFMTDIPFCFGYIGALYAFVRAIRRDELRWALIGSGLAALAFLARQVAALIPLAFALFVLLRALSAQRPPSFRALVSALPQSLRWILAAAAIPLAVVAIYFVWTQFLGGANWADRTRTLSGTVGFWLQAEFGGVLRRRVVIAAATIGIYLLPLWLALIRSIPHGLRAWRASSRTYQSLSGIIALAYVVTLVQLAQADDWFPYLTDILTRRGLRPYLAYFAYNMGAHRPLVLSPDAMALLTLAAGLLGLSLLALSVRHVGARISAECALVYVTTLVLAIASLTFFTFFERYLLPLIPGVIILLLDVTRRLRFSLRAGLVGVAVMAIVSVALMQDYFAWNEVKWNAGRALLANGVPIEKIDGGYEWDGWYLYDVSAAYIRAHGVPMTIDPWQYVLDPQYIFAFQPPPDYRIVDELKFGTPLRAGGSDKIFLLKRKE